MIITERFSKSGPIVVVIIMVCSVFAFYGQSIQPSQQTYTYNIRDSIQSPTTSSITDLPQGGEWNDTFSSGAKIASQQGIEITNDNAQIPHLIQFDNFVGADNAQPNPFLWSINGIGTDAFDFADVQDQQFRIALTLSGNPESLGLTTSNPLNSNSYYVDANFTVLDVANEDANITISDPLGAPLATVVIASGSSQAKVLTQQSSIYTIRGTSTPFFSAGTEYHYHAIITPTSFQVIIKRSNDLSTMWDSGSIGMDSLSHENFVTFSSSGTSGTGDTRFDNITIENTLTNGWLKSEDIVIPTNNNWDVLFIDKTELTGTTLNVTIYDANTDTPLTGFITLITDGEVDISGIISASVPAIYLNATLQGTGTESSILHFWGVSWSLPGVWRDTYFSGSKVSDSGLTRIKEGNVTLSPDPSSWTKYGGSPVLQIGTSSWDDHRLSFPCVIRMGSVYKMWYAASPSMTSLYEIGYATSTDGISWTKYSGNPVLVDGPTGSWDDIYVTVPRVIYDDGIYKMWYAGNDGTNSETGYATSTDGINWIKNADNPIFVNNGPSWESAGVGISCMINEKGWYNFWYGGGNGAVSRTGYAKSLTGFDFNRNPTFVLDVGPSGTWDDVWAAQASVARYDDDYEMIYSGWSGSVQEIGHATSTNGINWNKDAANPILQRGPASFDNDALGHPWIIEDESTFMMYYIGVASAFPKHYEIGLATTDFQSPTTLTSSGITIPSLSYAHILDVDKIVPSGTTFNVTVLNGANDQPITGYIGLTNSKIDLSNINPLTYPALKLQATLSSTGTETPILRNWSLNFTPDERPRVDDLTPSSAQVYRTDTIILTGNCSDKEELENDLIVDFSYKSPSDLTWQVSYLSDLKYENDYWRMNFTPPSTAELGLYTINISCQDMFGLLNKTIFTAAIQVLNNVPTTDDIDVSASGVYRTESVLISINGSDIEDIESDFVCTIETKSPNGQWTTLTSPQYMTTFWRTTFEPDKTAELGQYEFRAKMMDLDGNESEWYENGPALSVLNNIPIIEQPDPERSFVYRTNQINITFVPSDIEDGIEYLDIALQYKAPGENWEVLNTEWLNDQWHGSFTPEATAILGGYSLRAKVTDNDTGESYWIMNNNCFEVLNNIPGAPEIDIYPPEPRTGNDLNAIFTKNAIDTEGGQLDYSYQWYRNGEYQSSLTTKLVSADLTTKGDVWKCEVQVFDGVDWSTISVDEVTIRNTVPDVISPPEIIEINEDESDWNTIKLMDIFQDADEDPLTFREEGAEHLAIEIFQSNGTVIIRPEENWFGSEDIIFIANDTEAENSTTIKIDVLSVNDPPVMTAIGPGDPRLVDIEQLSEHHTDSY